MSNRYFHVAEYYDAEYAHSKMLQEDVPFFLHQLPRRKQSILELACGTGRAAIPLAQAGHRVVGIDFAPDMLKIARRKRDSVGLTDKQLRLHQGDVMRADLGEKFDWVCVFFNTFLAFTSLEQQDRVLRTMLRHLKPKGRIWLDIFQPDLAMLADPKREDLEPHAFFVPELQRTVYMSTSIVRRDAQVRHVTFRYLWHDEFGRERREKTEFDITFMFARELQLLLERHGLKIEQMWGNYDGSKVTATCPRLIVRCCRSTQLAIK